MLPLAATPLLFGIQQACEGFVWIGVGRQDSGLTQSAAMGFLFFAFMFWLFWIPFSAASLEPRRKVQLTLRMIAVLGLAGGAAFYIPILLNPGALLVTVVQQSIRYDIVGSSALDVVPQLVWQLCYVMVVSLPLLIVTKARKGLLVFSIGIIVSAAISHAVFWYAFASVWCLFAAILSLALAFFFHRLPLTTKEFAHSPLVA